MTTTCTHGHEEEDELNPVFSSIKTLNRHGPVAIGASRWARSTMCLKRRWSVGCVELALATLAIATKHYKRDAGSDRNLVEH